MSDVVWQNGRHKRLMVEVCEFKLCTRGLTRKERESALQDLQGFVGTRASIQNNNLFTK